ncbi:flagellar basal-body MS-ring/collar protein FliF [Kurthia huakuii]|uniref:flagellar basal-body MS-ring/collar protein FliF n=1 Tax=Kurthia huakuii TaxID=1421019 RepID=UPI000494FF8F|nr:flagellar basal-body MS-ring/collar protein FliF [Kurthia huakuii]MBM7698334.1 flagellar M-ring protein FliF [Kurthia huakuii]
MNERVNNIKTKFSEFWGSRSKKQKIALISSIVAIIALAAIITYFATRVTYKPLYSNLTASEVGQIKEQLDADGVKYQIGEGGTAIMVPENQADDLLVSLASQGYPQSGEIDYSFFSENAGFGMTDNEFNVLKIASIQTELAKLLKQMDGINDAKVMLSIPEKSTFVTSGENAEDSSASIVLDTQAGQQFSDEQIKTLYNLVAKSVPNLNTDNIIITNQYNEYFDLTSNSISGANGAGNAANQLAVKKQIERDLQRQVQSLLSNIMGAGKAVVTVTSDIDFTQEQRTEKLVEPVDKENMTGITISAQKISETYSGTGAAAAGNAEADGATDNFTDYQQAGDTGTGDYERTEDTVNNEVNRIKRQITESPYRVRDLGIQVVLEPPTADDPTSLPADTEAAVQDMLASIVRTSIDKNSAGDLTNADVAQKINVSVQKLNGKATTATDAGTTIPWWIWVIGGVLVVAIGLLTFFIIRSRRQNREEEYYDDEEYYDEEMDVEDIANEKDSEATVRRKQLEKMAKDKPEDFAKLLRTWISED